MYVYISLFPLILAFFFFTLTMKKYHWNIKKNIFSISNPVLLCAFLPIYGLEFSGQSCL